MDAVKDDLTWQAFVSLPSSMLFVDPLNLKVLRNNTRDLLMFTAINMFFSQVRKLSLLRIFFFICLSTCSKSISELGLKPMNSLNQCPCFLYFIPLVYIPRGGTAGSYSSSMFILFFCKKWYCISGCTI